MWRMVRSECFGTWEERLDVRIGETSVVVRHGTCPSVYNSRLAVSSLSSKYKISHTDKNLTFINEVEVEVNW